MFFFHILPEVHCFMLWATLQYLQLSAEGAHVILIQCKNFSGWNRIFDLRLLWYIDTCFSSGYWYQTMNLSGFTRNVHAKTLTFGIGEHNSWSCFKLVPTLTSSIFVIHLHVSHWSPLRSGKREHLVFRLRRGANPWTEHTQRLGKARRSNESELRIYSPLPEP